MAWWLQCGVGHRLVQAVPHLHGLSLRLPTLDCLPHHLPGAYEVPIPGFQASGRPLRSHRPVPHPHPTALLQGAPGPLWEKHSRTEEVVRVVGLEEVWPEPQQ